MDSRQYWNRRYLFDKAGSANTGEDFLLETVTPLYRQALREIEEEIEGMYGDFAGKENVTLAEAKRRISGADFKKMDFEAMAKEQAARRRELQKKKGSLPKSVVESMEEQHKKYESILAAYTKKGQISRLELLHVEIEKILLDMYDENQMNIYEFLADQYQNDYYRSVFRDQQMMGFGRNFVMVNEDAVERAVLNSYGRDNYSKTLWQHCGRLSGDLRENITVGLIRGESLERMASRISRRMSVARNNAYRLVRTETAYIYEQASMKAYEQCGIEKYKYLAALDGRTSPVCRELDGKVFRIKDAMPGKNYPPMHPNCRSTTVAEFDEGEDVAGTRLAKGGDGKYYEVPGDMTYKEWHKKYVGEQENEGRKAMGKIRDNITDLKEPIRLENIQYGKAVRRMVEENGTDTAKLLLQNYGRIYIINTDPSMAAYVPGKKGIRINMDRAFHDRRGKFHVLFHEIGHNVDDLLGRPSADAKFRKALEEDSKRFFSMLIDSGRCANMEEAYRYARKNIKGEMYSEVSDLLGGLTGNIAGKGHDEAYWKRDGTKVEKEAFAHFFAASLNGDSNRKEIMKEYFPAAFQRYEEMVRDEL